MEFLEKLRSLPETQRKTILWGAVIILGLLLFILWVKNVRQKLENFPAGKLKNEFQVPEPPKVEFPSFKTPELSQEQLNQLKEQLKETPLEPSEEGLTGQVKNGQ